MEGLCKGLLFIMWNFVDSSKSKASLGRGELHKNVSNLNLKTELLRYGLSTHNPQMPYFVRHLKYLFMCPKLSCSFQTTNISLLRSSGWPNSSNLSRVGVWTVDMSLRSDQTARHLDPGRIISEIIRMCKLINIWSVIPHVNIGWHCDVAGPGHSPDVTRGPTLSSSSWDIRHGRRPCLCCYQCSYSLHYLAAQWSLSALLLNYFISLMLEKRNRN